MLALEQLHIDFLIVVLAATALSIVAVRVATVLGKRHVARESARAIERSKV